ncbi:MAG: Eco57I restriction-modification methylase domain-containing protein [Elusimicrobiota bacterium]
MRGFVPTPEKLVDRMVERLFCARSVDGGVSVLDPGCGEGLFIDGVIRWCRRHKRPLPRITGIELHSERCRTARRKFHKYSSIEIREADFLVDAKEKFDFIVGNPPYVSIGHLSLQEKEEYRTRYSTARGRFDLYMLFFEQALRQLNAGGRLAFVTPEKFLYVDTAKPLRRLLASHRIKELSFVREDVFEGFVTYPLITVVDNRPPAQSTRVRLRDGSTRDAQMCSEQASWLSNLSDRKQISSEHVLADICVRVSCGIATGADSVFVRSAAEIAPELSRYAYPTIAGRQLTPDDVLRTKDIMLVPYGRDGALLAENALGILHDYFREPGIYKQLMARTCTERKPWYSFHDNAPLSEVLRPKLLCKDITSRPYFWVDREGVVLPRHSVYYVVPKHAEILDDLADYLNSPAASRWLTQECQRAANGFIRLQSNVLKRLPVPSRFASLAVDATC